MKQRARGTVLLLLLLLPLYLAAGCSSVSGGRDYAVQPDPLSVFQDFTRSLSDGKVSKSAKLAAENIVVEVKPFFRIEGKDQLVGQMDQLVASHLKIVIESAVTRGGTVESQLTVSSDQLRQRGVEKMNVRATFLVNRGLITHISIEVDPGDLQIIAPGELRRAAG